MSRRRYLLSSVLAAALATSSLTASAISTSAVADEGNQLTHCWVGFDNPHQTVSAKGKHRANGEASFVCVEGSNPSEKVTHMEMQAQLESLSKGRWQARAMGYAEADGAEILRLPLVATCFGEGSTIWRVKIVSAKAEESRPSTVVDAYEIRNFPGRKAELGCV